jgi:hypothetical protein
MVYQPQHSLKSWEEVSGVPEHYLVTCSCVGAGEAATEDACIAYLQEFTLKIIPFAKTIHEIPGALEKIIWVQTNIMPLTNRYLPVQQSDSGLDGDQFAVARFNAVLGLGRCLLSRPREGNSRSSWTCLPPARGS